MIRSAGIRGTAARGVLAGLVAGVAVSACGRKAPAVSSTPKEVWVDQPVSDWPDFVLSNDIAFADTTFSYLANAFVVDTGADTVGVTCKHIFMVLQNLRGTSSVALGDDFLGWTLRSSRDSTRMLRTQRLINEDPNESIGDFAGIKDRDWLIFELSDWDEGVYPLKVRYTAVKPGEVVYAIGRSRQGRHQPDPVLSPLRVYRTTPNYYYVDPLDPEIDAVATSGSPVTDQNGYLVGLVSGASGKLGVVAGVAYLRYLFDRYGIAYGTPEGS
jgi:hypothetical protein